MHAAYVSAAKKVKTRINSKCNTITSQKCGSEIEIATIWKLCIFFTTYFVTNSCVNICKETANIMSFRRKKQISFLKGSEIVYFLKGKALKEVSCF